MKEQPLLIPEVEIVDSKGHGMTRHISVLVTYHNISFEVTGEYEKYQPGVPYLQNGDPGNAPEGGSIEDMDILYDGLSFYDVLSDFAIAEIREAAEKEAQNA